MASCLTLIIMSAATVHHLLPKKLKPMGRLPFLPPSLSVARERSRYDVRLERLEERLRLLERLDDRDDGMPYTHYADFNFGDERPGAEYDISFGRRYAHKERTGLGVATHFLE